MSSASSSLGNELSLSVDIKQVSISTMQTKQLQRADCALSVQPTMSISGLCHWVKLVCNWRSTFGCCTIVLLLRNKYDVQYGPLRKSIISSTKLEVYNLSRPTEEIEATATVNMHRRFAAVCGYVVFKIRKHIWNKYTYHESLHAILVQRKSWRPKASSNKTQICVICCDNAIKILSNVFHLQTKRLNFPACSKSCTYQ